MQGPLALSPCLDLPLSLELKMPVKGTSHTLEARARISSTMTGRVRSAAERAAISDGVKRWWRQRKKKINAPPGAKRENPPSLDAGKLTRRGVSRTKDGNPSSTLTG